MPSRPRFLQEARRARKRRHRSREIGKVLLPLIPSVLSERTRCTSALPGSAPILPGLHTAPRRQICFERAAHTELTLCGCASVRYLLARRATDEQISAPCSVRAPCSPARGYFWLVFSLFVCSVSRLVPRLPTYPFTLLPLQHRTPPQPRVYPVYIGHLAKAPQLGAVQVAARTARASHAS